MNIEIERKFLVKGDFLPFVSKQYHIVQGYLCAVPGRTVRVRVKAEKAFITVKGRPNEVGFSRFEWEKEIAVSDALEMIPLCEQGVIEKIRYEVIFDGRTFEVDVFEGENKGLVLAELELEKEDAHYTLPEWIGKEVTTDVRYYNSYLSQHPYPTWEEDV